jgi:hypothetical protein
VKPRTTRRQTRLEPLFQRAAAGRSRGAWRAVARRPHRATALGMNAAERLLGASPWQGMAGQHVRQGDSRHDTAGARWAASLAQASRAGTSSRLPVSAQRRQLRPPQSRKRAPSGSGLRVGTAGSWQEHIDLLDFTSPHLISTTTFHRRPVPIPPFSARPLADFLQSPPVHHSTPFRKYLSARCVSSSPPSSKPRIGLHFAPTPPLRSPATAIEPPPPPILPASKSLTAVHRGPRRPFARPRWCKLCATPP